MKLTENRHQISASYTCNENLWVSLFSTPPNKEGGQLFSIGLLRTGEITSITFVDKSQQFDQIYRSADFIPSSTLTIEEFDFVENVHLKIKFSGTVHKEKNNLFTPSETLQIRGTITIKDFAKSTCAVFKDFIKLNNQLNFSNISRGHQETQPNWTVSYSANSLNGFNISFKNFTKFIPNMPLGTYNFNNLSSSEKIEFRKYTGPAQSVTQSIVEPLWQKYDTNGSFTIIEKTQINGFLVVKLKLNFTASLNGIVVYNFQNAEFETVM